MAVLRNVQKFLKSSGMPRTKFGRLAVNDPRLVDDMRNGRELGARMTARVEAFLAAQRGDAR